MVGARRFLSQALVGELKVGEHSIPIAVAKCRGIKVAGRHVWCLPATFIPLHLATAIGIECSPTFNSPTKAWERNRRAPTMDSDRLSLDYGNCVSSTLRCFPGAWPATLRANQEGLHQRGFRSGRRKFGDRPVARLH